MNIHWKDSCSSWSSNTLATWCKHLTHWKTPWCWERFRPRGEGDNRGWIGWMSSSIQSTWVWENSGRQWRTGKPGVLQLMGSQSWTWLSYRRTTMYKLWLFLQVKMSWQIPKPWTTWPENYKPEISWILKLWLKNVTEMLEDDD